MNQNEAKKTADYIFKEVFGVDNSFSLEELQKKFAADIPLPFLVKCALSGNNTWIFGPKEGKIASQEVVASRFQEDEWMKKKREIRSIEEILESWQEINFVTAEKSINSKEVSRSDGIYNSLAVYQSCSVFDSRNIIFSYKIFDSNYLLACRDDSSCSLGIHLKESIFCSSSFGVSWSNRVSQSMFIHDCFDLYECLFCSHIRSKKYCIANMPFGKEEYFRLKKLVVEWIGS